MSDPSSIERDFCPSAWSKRESVIMDHVALTTKDSERAHKDIPASLNNSYGSSKEEYVDLFGTDLPDSSPLFVYYTGGYWQDLSGAISAYPANAMYAAGVKTAVVSYNRAPGVSVSDIVSEAERGMSWVLSYAKKIGTSNIVFGGHSVGSQLCCMVVASDWFTSLPPSDKQLFSCVFLFGGLYDAIPILKTTINDAIKMDAAEAERISPMIEGNRQKIVQNAIEADMEIRLIWAEYDCPGINAQNQSFYKALVIAGCKAASLRMQTGVDHFNLVDQLSKSEFSITQEIVEAAKKKGR